MKRFALRALIAVASASRTKAARNVGVITGGLILVAGVLIIAFRPPIPEWIFGFYVCTLGVSFTLIGYVNFEAWEREREVVAEASGREAAEALSAELTRRLNELVREAFEREPVESEECESCNEHYRLGVRDALTAFQEARDELDEMTPNLRHQILKLVKTERSAEG